MSQPIASFKKVQEVLLAHGMYAKKHLGQNFIIDKNIIDKIADVAKLDQAMDVLEIGPGIGALTEVLCAQAKHVYAVEIDKAMVSILKDTCSACDNLTIFHEDFLKFDLHQIQSSNIMVCANLPYYVTSPILFKLFESQQDFKRIVVMVQKEVAARFKAKKDTKQYNALSIIAQACFDITEAFEISRHVFYPKPKVASSLLVFEPKDGVDIKTQQPFFDFIKQCFRFRRKTLANNLKDLVVDPSQIPSYLRQANLSETIRAQSCDLHDFTTLFKIINQNENED